MQQALQNQLEALKLKHLLNQDAVAAMRVQIAGENAMTARGRLELARERLAWDVTQKTNPTLSPEKALNLYLHLNNVVKSEHDVYNKAATLVTQQAFRILFSAGGLRPGESEGGRAPNAEGLVQAMTQFPGEWKAWLESGRPTEREVLESRFPHVLEAMNQNHIGPKTFNEALRNYLSSGKGASGLTSTLPPVYTLPQLLGQLEESRRLLQQAEPLFSRFTQTAPLLTRPSGQALPVRPPVHHVPPVLVPKKSRPPSAPRPSPSRPTPSPSRPTPSPSPFELPGADQNTFG
jgi:hypothetical protein